MEFILEDHGEFYLKIKGPIQRFYATSFLPDRILTLKNQLQDHLEDPLDQWVLLKQWQESGLINFWSEDGISDPLEGPLPLAPESISKMGDVDNAIHSFATSSGL